MYVRYAKTSCHSALLVMLSLFFAGCASRSVDLTETLTARFDREFELRLGQKATIEEGGFSIEFVTLLHDSRCPADVTCIQEGNADIEVAVRREGMPSRSLVLNTSRREKQEQKFDVYTIRLVQLVPYPRTDRATQQTDYGATLLVTRG